MEISLGPQVCGDLDAASRREWLVTDGLGGYAMGTVGGLRTRRYHGLLVVSDRDRPGSRRLGLAALDPVLKLGDRRVELATREWASGAIAPEGYRHLVRFAVVDGVPCWRWQVGEVIVDAELAMAHGRPAVGLRLTLVRADGPVGVEVAAVCTWRDVHGERFAGGDLPVEPVADGFVFDGAYRVRGSGYRPAGNWWTGSFQREEAARGLQPTEDLAHAGTFTAELRPGETVEIEAWAGDLAAPPPAAGALITAARKRAKALVRQAGAGAHAQRLLVHAADQFVVAGPTVVAGYPWFGDWSRDTFTSYEGLFLCTGRAEEGREVLRRATGLVDQGMLANTADAGGVPEFNTVDGTLWYLHALARHAEVTGDLELVAEALPTVSSIVEHHHRGTRFGIRVDPADGLITQGADGWALTWMDARIDGVPVTPRPGKPVEVNALWISTLRRLGALAVKVGGDGAPLQAPAQRAAEAFVRRFPSPGGHGLLDVVGGPAGDDATVRPNQLLAVSLPEGPLADTQPLARRVLDAIAGLVTPLGLRSLEPTAPGYRPQHRGGVNERDHAYHQGTVWPWLVGPYLEARLRLGLPGAALADALVAHLGDWGLGSVSETADGEAPHLATGCPFQAWSVAELNRALSLVNPPR
jgi:predicted glycogen debranching enzyme